MDEKDTKKSTTQGKGKNKNKKQTTMNLNDFVAAANTQAGFTAVSAMRWSDVMNDEDEDSSNYGGKNQEIILPTAPKSIRGPDIDINQVTNVPPFICYLSNLPFEASEDDIHKFFKELKITRVDLTRDPGASGRARGQGSCEFPDRKTLIDAFTFNNETIKNRPIKLSLNSFEAEREYNRRERDGDKEDRTAGDWRTGPKTERPAGYSSNFQSNRSDSNYFGNNRNRNNYENRGNYGANDSFGDNMNNNRSNNYNNRQSNRTDRNYNNSYQNNSADSNRYPPSNDSQLQRNDEPPKERPKLCLEKRTLPISTHQPLPQPPQHHSHQDNQSPLNTPPQRTSESETKSIEPEKPVERKRLILKPKTKKDEDSSSVQAPKANPSIFGEAKPVDTTKRLLEIEIKKKQELEEKEKLLDDTKLEKELVEKFEKPARDFNNQRGISREPRSSESSSHHGDNNRPQYRENRNDFSHDNNRNSNRYNDGGGYRKQQQQQQQGGGVRRINQTGNRNYNNDNYQNNNRDYNRENNNRDNYNSRDNQRGNKFNNNRNNNWNNDHMDNSKNRQPHEQNYDERPNRQGGNRRDRGNEGFNPPMNKFDLLKDDMD